MRAETILRHRDTRPETGVHANGNGHAPAPRTSTISVVIPAYNEAERVERCLRETVAALEELGFAGEVILVDDGSHDETLDLASQTAELLHQVRVMAHGVNLGKGSALVGGAYAARGDYVLFMDADLEVHPRQLALLYDALQEQDADVVIGSKLHPDSVVEYPPRRRIITMAYYIIVRILFGLPVRDTQTGLKLYRREVLMRVAPRLLVKRFAHDLEALVNAHRLGYRLVEVPVMVTRQRPLPRIGWRDVVNIGLDTLAIWYRTYLSRYYDRSGRIVDRVLQTPPDWRPVPVERRPNPEELRV
jgi:glycosyltransferase involved in cell wall biosynthesis